jgi:hypothetical protein
VVNAIRVRDGLAEIDWTKEFKAARVTFGVKTRSKRNYALSAKIIVPYLTKIPVRSPCQFFVFGDDKKNEGSAFYSCVATIRADWKANEGIAQLLFVSFLKKVLLEIII